MVDKQALDEVWSQLRATPGANMRQIHLRTGVSPLMVTQAVDELKRKGKIRQETLKKSRRFYPKDLAQSKRDRLLLAFMNQPRARTIMTHILQNPKIRQKELAQQLELDPPAAAYWLRHFEDSGVLDVLRKGTACHYRVKEPQRVKKALRLVDETQVFNDG